MTTDEWRAAWLAALDACEADVTEVEAMLAQEHRFQDMETRQGWQPPANIGQLPLDLRPRADAILQRQIAAAQALTLAMTANRRQAAFAAKVENGSPGKTPPSYVDQAL
ncbi:hypothetical protein GCM10010124_08520 [Pilimelia terevasa]|uniref:Uncharacterized protein n=1 Tax=Pilimelia terevasa TaxID=53372 RepID=A0A8J3BPC6_9ACTN|nr:hypothetical protein [Pilimelia terevasa]GGK18255.1 hypothetical protein GCM10010124_08520 [Pilimelia terevasa]